MCQPMTDNKVSIAKTIGGGYNEFWHNKNFYRVVKGSRGSKKSKTTALNFIYRLMQYEWANLLVVRRFSNTNKQSTYTDLKWATNQLGVTHLFKFNDSLPEITYKPTGQKILFRGIDDPLKITSITVDKGILSWCWIEEAYQVKPTINLQHLLNLFVVASIVLISSNKLQLHSTLGVSVTGLNLHSLMKILS